MVLDYLSKMKIAVVVRQLDRGHILWCGRVVRVERAHRIRIVRGVQKMLDVGRHGVIEFGHIRFVAHDHVVTYVFRKDEFVGCCVAHQFCLKYRINWVRWRLSVAILARKR